MKLAILDAGINIQRWPRERLHLWPVHHPSTAGRDFNGECGHNGSARQPGLPGNADEVEADHGTHLQSSPRSPIWPEKRDFRAIRALKMPLGQANA